jgi:putative thioredoxin
MMASDFIINVTEADFEYEVLAYSQQKPVVVDFWAEWCGPCKVLGPVLERLALEAQGGFRLAKLNVDNNPNLAIRYGVHGIPAVKAFRDGKVVSEFVGVQPEGRVREFLRAIAPSASDLTLEKARSMADMGQWKSAERAYRQVLAESPNQPAALLGLSRSLLLQGRAAEGQQLLQNFPASREFNSAETLRPLAEALARVENGVEFDDDDPLGAAYERALRLILRGNIPASMDGLLDILRQDKHYQNDEARKVILGTFELLGEKDPLTRQYRQELASVLF